MSGFVFEKAPMSDKPRWEVPLAQQPRPEDWDFDLAHALDSIVSLQSEIPETAFTASILGTERSGSGVVIGEKGLVLTIGYLVTEAENVWLQGTHGRLVPGHPIAIDQESGFGLVQALGDLETCVSLDLQAHGVAEVALRQFALQGLAQVGDLFLVDE